MAKTNEDFEREKQERKATLIIAIQLQDSNFLKECAGEKKIQRPEFTINPEPNPTPCKQCLFIYQDQACLMHNWIITPEMTACNDLIENVPDKNV